MFWWGGHCFDRSCGLSLDANRRWYASKASFLFDWKAHAQLDYWKCDAAPEV